jgi:hypothetical protein
MPAREPSLGQAGLQQAALYNRSPLGHPHVPPQPSSMPAREPSVGQSGAQHAPL